MHRHSVSVRSFAAAASLLAGFVDAVGFIGLGGFFVSFMSGNTTRLGVGAALHARDGAVAGGLIALFVMGVVLGALVGRRAGRRRRPVVLGIVCLLLAAAAALHGAHLAGPGFAAMALAMGAENALFEQDGDIQIGLTYMTGTLVKLGQRIADALTGGDRGAWIPYLAQWGSLALGGLAGALAFPVLGLAALWVAAGAALLLALVGAVVA